MSVAHVDPPDNLTHSWKQTNLLEEDDEIKAVPCRGRNNLPMSNSALLPEFVATPNEQVPLVMIPTYDLTDAGKVPFKSLG